MAVVDGLSPFLAALIVLIPFFIAGLFPDIQVVNYTSIGMALVTLFALELFLGRVSGGNLAQYGIKTLLVGMIKILISYFLGVWG